MDQHHYRVLITLYDPPSTTTSHSYPDHPLLPHTVSFLPLQLDQQFQQLLPHLVLPPIHREFWSLNLPNNPQIPSTTSTNRLGIPTSLLWSPSQPIPLSTPHSPALPHSQQQKPILDSRFGRIKIDWLKMGSTSTDPSSQGTTNLYFGSLHLYKQQQRSTKREEEEEDEDDGKTIGMVSVPGIYDPSWILKFIEPVLGGVEQIRMMRDSSPNRSLVLIRFRTRESCRDFKKGWNGKPYHSSPDSESCQLISISSIEFKTSSIPPYTFPTTPQPLPSISTPSTSTSHASLSSSRQITNTTKPSRQTKEQGINDSKTSSSMVELPLCPVCLERLDSKTTGLVQIQCRHSFHCRCLVRVQGSRCPVCRATNLKPSNSTKSIQSSRHSSIASTTTIEGGGGGGPRRSTEEGSIEAEEVGIGAEEESREEEVEEKKSCTTCRSEANLWICVICGNIGCGRYQGAHAWSHFGETGHSFSLELETGRIWSYTDDQYVHRLLRLGPTHPSSSSSSQQQQRLIELPSLPRHSTVNASQNVPSSQQSRHNRRNRRSSSTTSGNKIDRKEGRTKDDKTGERGGVKGTIERESTTEEEGSTEEGAEEDYDSDPEDLSLKIADSYSHYHNDNTSRGGGGRGPDRTAEEEQDKLEQIAIEYSSLLHTNLNEQREWFEGELRREKDDRGSLEGIRRELERRVEGERKEGLKVKKELEEERERFRKVVEGFEKKLETMEKELERCEIERKKERKESLQERRQLERLLESERTVTRHLTENLSHVRREVEVRTKETNEVKGEVEELRDQLNDLMAALTLRDRIEQEGESSELRGGSLGVASTTTTTDGAGEKSPSQALAEKRKKKNKTKK